MPLSDQMASAFRAAANILVEGKGSNEGYGLLTQLGAVEDQEIENPADLALLLKFGCGLERIFDLPMPDAPGLHAFGAEIRPGAETSNQQLVSVSGVGTSRLSAFRACLGEAVEVGAQYLEKSSETLKRCQLPQDVIEAICGLCDSPLALEEEVNCVAAHCINDNQSTCLPARFCYRDEDIEGPQPGHRIGMGCASGVTFDAALSRAVLEWVERDATALWWRGGQRGRAVSAEALAHHSVNELVAESRDGLTSRQTWFLDISTEIDIPVVAALSVSGEGRALAYGFAARSSVGEAARSAFLELCQIELADRVVAAKIAERGIDALNDIDRMHRNRTSFAPASIELLYPHSPPVKRAILDDASMLQTILDSGRRIYIADQTSAEIGIPVCRAIISGLQPDPSEVESQRLAKTQRRNASTLCNHPDMKII